MVPDVEKVEGVQGSASDAPATMCEVNYYDGRNHEGLRRKLKQRHVQMIAISGTMGTGLFLGSGHTLATAGPAGSLIAFALVGSVAYSSLCAVAEMTAHAPVSGIFPYFAARWVDPALGFAMGWTYFYAMAIAIPSEITAAQIILTFWDENKNHAPIYTAAMCLAVCVINTFGVRWFGEFEFCFSLLKITLITTLIIVGLLIDLGADSSRQPIGFRYWIDPGAFNASNLAPNNVGLGRLLSVLNVFIQAGFSYQGMELVAVAASETESPRRNITKAVRRVFYRIVIFYMFGTFITGLLVPYNDVRLLQNTGNAAQSPFVIAIRQSGIKFLPSVINAGVFMSAFSAANSFFFCSSRILYGLALRGQAPKIFSKLTKSGLPVGGLLLPSCFVFLAFMNTRQNSERVFMWFMNLDAIAGFLIWLFVNVTFLFFYRGKRYQNIDRAKTGYFSCLQPWLSIWGIFWITIFISLGGLSTFFHFNMNDFLIAYVNIPIFIGLYLGWKYYKRTKFVKLSEMDFVTDIPTMEETEIPEIQPRTVAEKVSSVLF